MPWIVPILHPSYIIRGAWAFDPDQPPFLARAWDIAQNGWQIEDPTSYPLHWNGAPSMMDLCDWQCDVREGANSVAIDIEAAGHLITMLGLCNVGTLDGVTFWIRRDGGGFAYPMEELRARVGWLYDLLADEGIPKVFHNGQSYDIVQLENAGFDVQGYQFDTMLAPHILVPEQRKRLEYQAKVHLGSGGWKYALKDDAEGEHK